MKEEFKESASLMLLRIANCDAIFFYRDAEIIYGKVLSQKRVNKRRKVESNVTDSAISTCLSEDISFKELNRNKV